jgi:hypothetical protein
MSGQAPLTPPAAPAVRNLVPVAAIHPPEQVNNGRLVPPIDLTQVTWRKSGVKAEKGAGLIWDDAKHDGGGGIESFAGPVDKDIHHQEEVSLPSLDGLAAEGETPETAIGHPDRETAGQQLLESGLAVARQRVVDAGGTAEDYRHLRNRYTLGVLKYFIETQYRATGRSGLCSQCGAVCRARSEAHDKIERLFLTGSHSDPQDDGGQAAAQPALHHPFHLAAKTRCEAERHFVCPAEWRG